MFTIEIDTQEFTQPENLLKDLAMQDCLRLARPHQFIKNGFIFLPIFFGHKLTDPDTFVSVCLAFVSFCLISAAVYCYNDIKDVDEDRRHPTKRYRPIAAGRISMPAAYASMAALLASGLLLSLSFLGLDVVYLLLFYLAINLAYTLKLKQVALIDVTCIAVGFVLRVEVGGLAGNVEVSHWLALMTFLLALFLALGKRYDDFKLSSGGNMMRKSISGYNLEFIQAAMVAMAAVTIVCYIMYAVSPQTVEYYGRNDVYMTTFWVILGILRYLQLTFVLENSGSPTKVMFQDRFIQLIMLGWLATFSYFLYAIPE